MKNSNHQTNPNAVLFNKFQASAIKKNELKALKGGTDIVIIEVIGA